MEVKGILFDFDGVLADTMEDNYEAWRRAFEKFNIEISKEDYFILEGRKLIEVAEILGAGHGLGLEDWKRIVELKNKFYLDSHSFRFYPGVVELIQKLRNKVKMCIVSASPGHKIEKTVPKEFLSLFNAVVSGDDTERGKPNPDPYLSGCKKLALSPQECIVVENAPLGITSAKSAGIFCIAITSTLDKSFLKDADVIIERFEDLKNTPELSGVLESQ